MSDYIVTHGRQFLFVYIRALLVVFVLGWLCGMLVGGE